MAEIGSKKIGKLVVTGDANFIQRYRFFMEALSERSQHLECVASGDVYDTTLSGKAVRTLYQRTSLLARDKNLWWANLHKRKAAFIRKSRQTERKIQHLTDRPDLVFHLFGMYAPFSRKSAIPFTMSLDFTMALAAAEWRPWAPFPSDKDRRGWMESEKEAYERAAHLFPWSHLVKQSLIDDYGIRENKITVTGSSGQFRHLYEGDKAFGSHQLIFNGSDWDRKGGGLVLAAFQQVRQALPKSQLVIVGSRRSLSEPGVICPGYISSPSEMQALFLNSDLVVAPAKCDPFPGFLIEGMNYGVPCVVSGSSSMPEIVDHDSNGLVLPHPTPEVLSQSIISLLQDAPRLEHFSVSAREKVKNKLNWDSIAAKIFDALTRQGIAKV